MKTRRNTESELGAGPQEPRVPIPILVGLDFAVGVSVLIISSILGLVFERVMLGTVFGIVIALFVAAAVAEFRARVLRRREDGAQ